MTIEIRCQQTGLQAYVTREHCQQSIRDKVHETAYECLHCGFYHPGPREMCPTTGKRGYLSERACWRDIERAWTDPTWKAKLHGRMPRRAYRCPSCGLWHMGTNSRSREELAADGHVDPALLPLDSATTVA